MWKFQDGGFIPGVPPRDMTDTEFEAVCEDYETNNQVPPDQKGCLKRSPLYKHVKDAPPEAKEE